MTVSEAWVRVSRTCQNACAFCSDADALDGADVPLAVITADLDRARAEGAEAVVLSGGEPTLNRALLGAIRHAKSLGLRVALATNGRILAHDRFAIALRDAGLDEARVSLHASRRRNHEILTGREGSWVESKAALKILGRNGIRTVLSMVYTRETRAELPYLMHMGMMDGIQEMWVRGILPLGRGASEVCRGELQPRPAELAEDLDALWFRAKEENVLLRVFHFDDTADIVVPASLEQPARSADEAALLLLQARVVLLSARRGMLALAEDGTQRAITRLVGLLGGLDAVAQRFAALGAPLRDVPRCLGGMPDRPVDGGTFVDGCSGCTWRSGCPGLSPRLARLAGSAPKPR